MAAQKRGLWAKSAGGEAATRAPPIVTGLKLGLSMGAGTDAHRVMSYNPFVALRWILDGKSVAGTALRGSDEIPNRSDPCASIRRAVLGSPRTRPSAARSSRAALPTLLCWITTT
jgi:predicted amidohydrolase YtcJ